MDLKVGARRAARKTFLRENASSTIKTQSMIVILRKA
jgi:hypothetical protein